MLLFNDSFKSFGLLVMGVCPGGLASNFWTLLLGGDVNLSITMTFVSSIAAMGNSIDYNIFISINTLTTPAINVQFRNDAVVALGFVPILLTGRIDSDSPLSGHGCVIDFADRPAWNWDFNPSVSAFCCRVPYS